MIRAGLLAALLALPHHVAGQDSLPAPLQQLLSQRQAECSGFDEGTLTLEDGAVAQADLDGDGQPDWVLDESHLRCSSAASLYCGTGGCGVSFLVNDVLSTHLAKGWALTELGPLRAVLLQVHGSRCGGINPTPCVEALVWDPGAARFSTVAPQFPEPSDPIPAPVQ
ncbi:MAG: hypothetical protein KDA50_08315 [Rhodobacteraceae bacterium]|nr:hypothetical protein [Paracoccaceae bacterium]